MDVTSIPESPKLVGGAYTYGSDAGLFANHIKNNGASRDHVSTSWSSGFRALVMTIII